MPAITKPNQHFDATTYSGSGGTQSVTNAGSFQPDFVWIKNRTTGYSHLAYNSIVGAGTAGTNKALQPDTVNAESTVNAGSTYGYLSAFNSNGFTVVQGSDATSYTNGSGQTYVAWNWKAGAAAVTNNDGTISSQVSANPTAGFSVVTWTGNGVTAATVGHGLQAIPAMIICKERSGTDYWHVKHKSTGTNTNLFLNTTSASTSAASVGDGILGDLSSNTTFGFATAGSPNNVVAVNENGITNVAYCWSEIPGYSSFGSYTGNGLADGPFVYCGFRPAFVLIKSTTGNNWTIVDNKRDTSNVATKRLFPSSAVAEATATNNVDMLSNGFKVRVSEATDAGANASGVAFIYAAFAEAPFKYANAR